MTQSSLLAQETCTTPQRPAGLACKCLCQRMAVDPPTSGYQDPGEKKLPAGLEFSIACSIVLFREVAWWFFFFFCCLTLFFAFWWVVHLVIPGIDTKVTTIRHGVLKLGAVDGAAIGSELATEVGIVIWAGLVESSNIAVASSPLAVGLGVVGVQVVAPRECSVAARHPANMGLLLGVALHVALQVLLALETALATGLLALELHLLDDRGQVLKAQVGTHKLLLGRLARGLTVAQQTIVVDRRGREFFLVLVSARYSADGSITSCRCAQGD